jgi:hypothetical protein
MYGVMRKFSLVIILMAGWMRSSSLILVVFLLDDLLAYPEGLQLSHCQLFSFLFLPVRSPSFPCIFLYC